MSKEKKIQQKAIIVIYSEYLYRHQINGIGNDDEDDDYW